MPRTRSQPALSATKTSPPACVPKPPSSLPASTSNPPKLFILPKNTSKDARILTLNNPATCAPSRYLFCPHKGFYEFTRIAAQRGDCRSWLIAGSPAAAAVVDSSDGQEAKKEEEKEEKEEGEKGEKRATKIGSGYVTQKADLFIATPIDAMFLILPALLPQRGKDKQQQQQQQQHFLALDDYLDILCASSAHWKALLAHHGAVLSATMEKRMRRLCDTVSAGDEPMYRLSHDKLLAVLMGKVQRMVGATGAGLPASLEEQYVSRVLEVPVMDGRRAKAGLGADSDVAEGGAGQAGQEEAERGEVRGEKEELEPASPDMHLLLRSHVSLHYLCASYLPPTLTPSLLSLASPRFQPLTQHLASIAALKAEAMALRSLADNVSRKRVLDPYGNDENDDKNDEQEEKRRKRRREGDEEEKEKRKKAQGRGVKQLAKVDTSGMKKMSTFFVKLEKPK